MILKYSSSNMARIRVIWFQMLLWLEQGMGILRGQATLPTGGLRGRQECGQHPGRVCSADTAMVAWGIQDQTRLGDMLLHIYTVKYQVANSTWPDNNLQTPCGHHPPSAVKPVRGQRSQHHGQPDNTVSWVTMEPVLNSARELQGQEDVW